ncbi:MAG TPA: acyltransferase [Solirubrobacteraceae bacterium]|nr:acyltransferase [Solirubrobacteraceae bacterium]
MPGEDLIESLAAPVDPLQAPVDPPVAPGGQLAAAVDPELDPPGPAEPIPGRPAPPPSVPLPLRDGPPPRHGGPLTLWRFARRHRMLRPQYAGLVLRWAWLKLRYRGRLITDGLCFIMPGVTFEIGPQATVVLGRWSWLGHGTKVRVHEGVLEIGAKSVLGQECTLSCYQHISVGRECIIADRTMMIDFDHGVVDTERPIRAQGIYKRDVSVGHNVWIGYGACLLRGVRVGNNAVIGTSAVVTADVPDDAVAAGVPARVIRYRDAPQTFRWG